jgi:hypothetical protein
MHDVLRGRTGRSEARTTMIVRLLGTALSACLWAVLALVLGGCGLFTENMRGFGRAATKGVGDELPNLKGPLSATLRDTLLGNDLLEQTAQRLTSGTLHTLESELQKGELTKVVDDLVAHALERAAQRGGEATKQLIQGAGPELRQMLREIVLSTVATASGALKDSIQKDLTAATQLLARSTAEALVATMVRALEGELGQQLKQTVGGLGQQLVADAASKLREPASRQAVSEFTESAMKGAVRGTRDGINEGLPNRLQVALISGLVVCATLLLVVSLGFFLLFYRYRQSTKSLAIIAQKINETDAKSLKQQIQKSASANYLGPWLSSFLKQRGL